VLERVGSGNGGELHAEFRCAECGATATGRVEAACCCGAEERADGRGAKVFTRSLGLECVRNPEPTDEVPLQVLVRQRRAVHAIRGVAMPARVEVAGQI
jgi:hypothetical protein